MGIVRKVKEIVDRVKTERDNIIEEAVRGYLADVAWRKLNTQSINTSLYMDTLVRLDLVVDSSLKKAINKTIDEVLERVVNVAEMLDIGGVENGDSSE